MMMWRVVIFVLLLVCVHGYSVNRGQPSKDEYQDQVKPDKVMEHERDISQEPRFDFSAKDDHEAFQDEKKNEAQGETPDEKLFADEGTHEDETFQDPWITDWIRDKVNKVKGFFKSAKEKWLKKWSEITDFGGNRVQWLKDKLGGAYDGFKGFLDGLSDVDLKEALLPIWMINIKDGLSDYIEKAYHGAYKVVGGDMVVPKDWNDDSRTDELDDGRKRSVHIKYGSGYKWKKARDGRVKIPFVKDIQWSISKGHHYSNIDKTVEFLRKNTCVDWVELPKKPQGTRSEYPDQWLSGQKVPRDWVRIANTKSGCWSYRGRNGGQQVLNLAWNCWGIRKSNHEMGHAMGLGHEQNHPNRDKEINIFWDKVQSGRTHEFKIMSTDVADKPHMDFDSVMIYGSRFMGNWPWQTTMAKKDGSTWDAPDHYTARDVAAINKLYECSGYKQDV